MMTYGYMFEHIWADPRNYTADCRDVASLSLCASSSFSFVSLLPISIPLSRYLLSLDQSRSALVDIRYESTTGGLPSDVPESYTPSIDAWHRRHLFCCIYSH